MHLQKKKRHHFVWRKYLRAWAKDESVYCLMNGRVFPTNLMNVGQEKYFYRLKELKLDEIEFLKNLVAQSASPMLRSLNEGWISLFNKIFEIRHMIHKSGKSNREIEGLIDTAICNAEEELHSKIESEGELFLNLLYEKDLSFCNFDDDLISFFYYICVQYFRTQRMAANLKRSIGSFRDFNIDAMGAVLRHVMATNVAWTLFADRKNVFPVLLKNETSVPFITGDQPVINTYAVGLTLEDAPDDLEFYYPISPQLALLLTKDSRYQSQCEHNVSESKALKCNADILDQSERQLYASEKSVLESISEASKHSGK